MEEPVARAPLARPPRRQRSTLCTLCSIVALVAALGAVYLSIRATRSVMYALNTFHSDLPDVDPKLAAAHLPLARPLLDKDTPFNVRATVWLDVTQHVEQGLPLPSLPHSRFFSYTVADVDRSELILFDDIVAHNITMMAPTLAKLPLDIPVEPLYTQDLGPSSLRVAFTVVPSNEALEGLGQLATVSSIFRWSKQLLPRTPDSERLKPGFDGFEKPHGIESIPTAMDQNGASVPLLTLLPAGILHNASPSFLGGGSQDCARLVETTMPFLDNAWPNRHFVNRVLKDTQGDRLYLDEFCRVHLPHVRSRVSLVMLKDYRSFYYAGYRKTQSGILSQHLMCNTLPPNSELAQLNLEDDCRMIRKHGPLELLLTFNGTEASSPAAQQHRYAPALRTRRNAGHLRHHLTLPRRRPSGDVEPTSPASPCAIPRIELSGDHDYFHADIEVQISTHQALRSNVGEYFNIFSQPSDPESLPLDEGQDVTLNSTLEMEVLWEAKSAFLGDRIHPKHRPAMSLVSFLDFAVQLVIALLDILYWSSRTTTAGLAMGAQWMSLSASVLVLLEPLYDLVQNFSISNTLFFFMIAPLDFFRIYYQGSVLLRLTPSRSRWSLTRRPMWKSEVRSAAVAKRSLVFGSVWVPAALTLVSAAYYYFLRPHKIIIREAQGCFSPIEEQDDGFTLSESIPLFAASLGSAAVMMQLLFNAMGAASSPSSNKRGTFAGRLKWAVYLDFVVAYFVMAVNTFERIGGWSPRQYAIGLHDVQRLLELAIAAFQALRCPAIVQPVPGSGEWAATTTSSHEEDEDTVPLLQR